MHPDLDWGSANNKIIVTDIYIAEKKTLSYYNKFNQSYNKEMNILKLVGKGPSNLLCHEMRKYM